MKTLLLFSFVVIPFLVFGQSFEGTLVVEISYDLPADQKSMENMLPKKQTIKIKNEWARMEQDLMGSKTIVIANSESGISTMLLDTQGTKFKTQISQPLDAVNAEISILDETKNILGYNCKLAKLTMENGTIEVTVFYTEDLPAPKVKGMPDIDGFPLEYKMESMGMKVHYITTSITKEPLSNDLFIVPVEYIDMPESMRAMMGLDN